MPSIDFWRNDSMAADNGTVDVERGFIAGYKEI